MPKHKKKLHFSIENGWTLVVSLDFGEFKFWFRRSYNDEGKKAYWMLSLGWLRIRLFRTDLDIFCYRCGLAFKELMDKNDKVFEELSAWDAILDLKFGFAFLVGFGQERIHRFRIKKLDSLPRTWQVILFGRVFMYFYLIDFDEYFFNFLRLAQYANIVDRFGKKPFGNIIIDKDNISQ